MFLGILPEFCLNNRDATIVTMVQNGASLNSAQNWYKEFAMEAGISNTRIGHKTEALEYIAAAGYDILDEEQRNQLKAELQKEFDVVASTANDYVRAYAEANGIDLPKANFGGNPEDKAKIFEWIVDNKDCDKSEFRKFMVEEMGRSSGSIDETWRGVLLARDLQEAGVVFG